MNKRKWDGSHLALNYEKQLTLPHASAAVAIKLPAEEAPNRPTKTHVPAVRFRLFDFRRKEDYRYPWLGLQWWRSRCGVMALE